MVPEPSPPAGTASVGEGSVVKLPAGVLEPFEVYVNGVLQRRGVDYEVRRAELRFGRRLVQEGRISAWRWLVGAFGVGTYRPNHSVDVRYELDGRPMLAQALAIEPGRQEGQTSRARAG